MATMVDWWDVQSSLIVLFVLIALLYYLEMHFAMIFYACQILSKQSQKAAKK